MRLHLAIDLNDEQARTLCELAGVKVGSDLVRSATEAMNAYLGSALTESGSHESTTAANGKARKRRKRNKS